MIKSILRGGRFSLLSQGLVAPRDGLADLFHEGLGWGGREGGREGGRGGGQMVEKAMLIQGNIKQMKNAVSHDTQKTTSLSPTTQPNNLTPTAHPHDHTSTYIP